MSNKSKFFLQELPQHIEITSHDTFGPFVLLSTHLGSILLYSLESGKPVFLESFLLEKEPIKKACFLNSSGSILYITEKALITQVMFDVSPSIRIKSKSVISKDKRVTDFHFFEKILILVYKKSFSCFFMLEKMVKETKSLMLKLILTKKFESPFVQTIINSNRVYLLGPKNRLQIYKATVGPKNTNIKRIFNSFDLDVLQLFSVGSSVFWLSSSKIFQFQFKSDEEINFETVFAFESSFERVDFVTIFDEKVLIQKPLENIKVYNKVSKSAEELNVRTNNLFNCVSFKTKSFNKDSVSFLDQLELSGIVFPESNFRQKVKQKEKTFEFCVFSNRNQVGVIYEDDVNVKVEYYTKIYALKKVLELLEIDLRQPIYYLDSKKSYYDKTRMGEENKDLLEKLYFKAKESKDFKHMHKLFSLTDLDIEDYCELFLKEKLNYKDQIRESSKEILETIFKNKNLSEKYFECLFWLFYFLEQRSITINLISFPKIKGFIRISSFLRNKCFEITEVPKLLNDVGVNEIVELDLAEFYYVTYFLFEGAKIENIKTFSLIEKIFKLVIVSDYKSISENIKFLNDYFEKKIEEETFNFKDKILVSILMLKIFINDAKTGKYGFSFTLLEKILLSNRLSEEFFSCLIQEGLLLTIPNILGSLEGFKRFLEDLVMFLYEKIGKVWVKEILLKVTCVLLFKESSVEDTFIDTIKHTKKKLKNNFQLRKILEIFLNLIFSSFDSEFIKSKENFSNAETEEIKTMLVFVLIGRSLGLKIPEQKKQTNLFYKTAFFVENYLEGLKKLLEEKSYEFVFVILKHLFEFDSKLIKNSGIQNQLISVLVKEFEASSKEILAKTIKLFKVQSIDTLLQNFSDSVPFVNLWKVCAHKFTELTQEIIEKEDKANFLQKKLEDEIVVYDKLSESKHITLNKTPLCALCGTEISQESFYYDKQKGEQYHSLCYKLCNSLII